MSTAGDGAQRRRTLFSPANLAIVALGVALLVIYRHVHGLVPGTPTIAEVVRLALAQCALYAIACVVVWRAPSTRTTLLLVIALAALFRVEALRAGPRLSDDIYRYVWDGRVQAEGINPYRHVPADEALAGLRDEAIYAKINRRDYAPTIYPPLAQMIFFAATRVSESVAWMKTVFVLFEAVAVWAVVSLLASFGLPRQRVLLLAWHPLLVYEIAGSGHLDAIMICFVCLALVARRRGRDGLTGFLLACAVLTKFFPVVIAPALYRRWDWRLPLAFIATFVAGYLPYLSVGLSRVVGYLPGYANEEGLQNGVRFFILTLARKIFGEIPSAAYVLFALAVLCALSAWALWRRGKGERDFVTAAFVLAAAFVVLLSPRYSWYFAWPAVFLPLLRPALVAPVVYLSAASFVLYWSWLDDRPEQMFVYGSIMYFPFAALCLMAWLLSRFRKKASYATVAPEPAVREE